MLKPVLSGKDLIEDIAATEFPGDGVAVWWLGQSGYVYKSREATVYIDPYLSDSLTQKYKGTEKPHIRMTASPLRPSQVGNADIVISTHKHSDHMDPETAPAILKNSPASVYVVPRAHMQHVTAWGIQPDRIIPADADESLYLKGIELCAIPSAHEQLDYTEEAGYPYMGFIIRMGGMTLYHSGDCIPYNGLIQRLLKHKPDVAFLPVNGRDERRRRLKVPGNFTIQEAFSLCSLSGIETMVPNHYDMFTFNTVPVEDIIAWDNFGFRGKLEILQCGKKIVLYPE
jgi:L-ascorbate metabolism protein UlaG (beta-lactamase superfamily)